MTADDIEVLLAGVPVRPALLSALVALLDEGEPLHRKLSYELERKSPVVILTVQERVAVVGALSNDPPAGLQPLRRALLDELKRRQTWGRPADPTGQPSERQIHDA